MKRIKPCIARPATVTPARPRRRRRPEVERLEDRAVPAIFTVNTTLDTQDAAPGDGLAQDSAGRTSLRAAVMEANALAGADTIDLPAGTYALGFGGAEENGGRTGDLDVLDDLTVVGAGAGTTTITAANLNDRIFDVSRGTSTAARAASFQGLTFTGGRVVQVTDNLGDRGGAMRIDFFTNVTVADCVFRDNSAPRTGTNFIFGLGGAISGSGRLTVTGTTFDRNHASNSGGAIYVGGSGAVTVIRDCWFTANTSHGGGAIKNHQEMRIDNTTFSDNNGGGPGTSSGQGGAIDNNGGGNLTLTNCTLTGNGATFGGAIYNADRINVINCTIAGNTANYGGGLRGSFSGVDAFTNTIIAGNTASTRGPDVDGTVRSGGHNLVGNTTDSTGWSTSLGDLLNADPLLAALADNGGPTRTRALLAGSPALDAADTAAAPAGDQRGVSRPQGAAADIGAFEAQAGNSAPVAADQSPSTNEDTALSATLSAADADGDALTFAVVTGPARGTVQLNAATGAYTYTPDANYNGPDSFTFKANDGQADSNVATASITVNAVNDAPAAAHDAYAVNEDTVLTIAKPGVLGNDTDVEGSALTAAVVSGPANGLLTLNGDGSFTYRPRFDFNGTDSFTYKARDGAADSNVATVTITVNAVNDAPRPGPIVTEVTTDEDTEVGGQLNATDPEGDSFTYAVQAGYESEHGTVTVNADGTWTYTPDADFHGTDAFIYRVTDEHGAFALGGVEITVTPVNDAPAAADDAYAVDEDGTLVVSVDPVTRLHMVSDPGDFIGQGLTWDFTPAAAAFSAGTNPDNGVVVSADPPALGEWWDLDFAAPFSAPLTPGVYEGATRWPFQADAEPGLDVSGNGRGLNRLRGAFTVYDVAYGPGGTVSRFAAAFVQQDHNFDDTLEPPLRGVIVYNSTFGAAGGVLGNDVDVDGDLLPAAVLVSGPSHGTLVWNGDGTFTYTPDANFHGTDTFTYRATDGQAEGNVATVTLTVNPVNDAPAAQDDAATTDEDTAVTIAVLGNDTDIDGDALTPALVSGVSHGILVLNDDGTFKYTPDPDFHGTDSFTYKVSDGALESEIATVSITITPVNDAPTAAADAWSTAEDTALTIAAPGVLGNDSDADGDALAAVLVSGPAHGDLTLNGDGSFTYTPDADFHGTDSFTYKADDGAAQSAAATVTITVTPVNDAPAARDDSYAVTAGSTLNVAAGGVLANDTDADGDALAAVLVSGPAHGALTLNADGSFRYTAAAGFVGTDTFTYKAGDGAAQSGAATVTITVRPSNQPGVTLEPDPCDPDGLALVIRGTSGPDTIDVKRAGAAGPIEVVIRGTDFNFTGSYTVALTRVIVYGQAGPDDIRVQDTVTLPALLFGGDGNDYLRGGGGPSVLVGGDGDDNLASGGGRAVLIGGRGRDKLQAYGSDAVLIGGSTAHDADPAALCAIMEEWASSRGYAARVAALAGWFNSSAVDDDDQSDWLGGGTGMDWFLAAVGSGRKDKLNGRQAGETLTDTTGW